MHLPSPMLATIEIAFNRLLKEQPGIVPASLNGKSVCVDLSGMDAQLYFYFSDQTITLLAESDQIDAVIQGSPIALMAAAQGNAKDLKLSGDLQLAQAFESLLKSIDPDWEEWLSRVTGDAIAFQLGQSLRKFNSWRKQSTENFKTDLRDYLQTEIRLLPTPPEVDVFNTAVDELRAATERFEMRLERLHRKMQTPAEELSS